MIKKSILTLIAAFACATTSHSATIVWGSVTGANGFGDETGADLAIGSAVRLGVFKLTDAAVQQAGADMLAGGAAAIAAYDNLRNNFVELAAGAIGDGTLTPGIFARQDTTPPTDNVNGFNTVGRQLYILAYNASNPDSALQIGIFAVDLTINNRWAVPSDQPIAGSTSIDLADMTNATGTAFNAAARQIYGSGLKGTSGALGGPNVSLGIAPVIPEPTTFCLLGLSIVGMAARRRRI